MLNSFHNLFIRDLRLIQYSVRLWSTSAEQNIQSGVEEKILKLAVIGMPNAGKSTFINKLMDRKVCPVSRKVHTTRKKAMAIFTENESQIVFLDTPGLVSLNERNRFGLERSFLVDSKACLSHADMIGVIHDVGNIYTRGKLDLKVIRLLEKYKEVPSFLVFNKVDVLRTKRKLLELTRQITDNCVNGQPVSDRTFVKRDDDIRGWPYFQEVFMVSALTGSGMEEVRTYLKNSAKPGKWMFPADIWSDQTAEEIITKSVQARFLDYLPDELPYKVKVAMEYFNINDEGIINTVVLVTCPTVRIAKLIAGSKDGRLRQITESVQDDLQRTFRNYVKIRIALEPLEEKN